MLNLGTGLVAYHALEYLRGPKHMALSIIDQINLKDKLEELGIITLLLSNFSETSIEKMLFISLVRNDPSQLVSFLQSNKTKLADLQKTFSETIQALAHFTPQQLGTLVDDQSYVNFIRQFKDQTGFALRLDSVRPEELNALYNQIHGIDLSKYDNYNSRDSAALKQLAWGQRSGFPETTNKESLPIVVLHADTYPYDEVANSFKRDFFMRVSQAYLNRPYIRIFRAEDPHLVALRKLGPDLIHLNLDHEPDLSCFAYFADTCVNVKHLKMPIVATSEEGWMIELLKFRNLETLDLRGTWIDIAKEGARIKAHCPNLRFIYGRDPAISIEGITILKAPPSPLLE